MQGADMTYETRVLSITVAQALARVSAYLSDPRNFPQWASGLAGGLDAVAEDASAGEDGSLWRASSPAGEVSVRFTPANDHGVADHWVLLPDGTTVYVPLRAVANGSGTEVSLMLFRLPSMDALKFEEDTQWVMRDLRRLKDVLESRGEGT
jgi:hypothetical protein